MKRTKKWTFALLLSSLALMGCKETLYSNLSEVEANEMVAVLASSEVHASRVSDKKGLYAVRVDSSEIASATVILKNADLPRPSFQSLGDVFSAGGIIGTPFEQQARFIHALNQELSRAITEINGISMARVIVNAPLKDRYNAKDKISTASVTLHYEPAFEPQHNLSKIKQLVSHSVPDLNYDNVSVVFFPSTTLTIASSEDEETSHSSLMSATIVDPNLVSFLPGMSRPITMILIILLVFGAIQWRLRRVQKVSSSARSRVDFTGRL